MIDQLLASNRAYKCYCTEEELEAEREEQRERGEMPHYGGKCANLTPEEQAEKKHKVSNQLFVSEFLEIQSISFMIW